MEDKIDNLKKIIKLYENICQNKKIKYCRLCFATDNVENKCTLCDNNLCSKCDDKSILHDNVEAPIVVNGSQITINDKKDGYDKYINIGYSYWS